MEFWDEVTLIPAVTEIDGLATPRRVPGPDGPTVPAVVQQSTTEEDDTVGQRTTTSWRCFLPPDADIDAFGYARWRGGLFEVEGEPALRDGPDGPHHVEARLRRVR